MNGMRPNVVKYTRWFVSLRALVVLYRVFEICLVFSMVNKVGEFQCNGE
jgi:hypothetical protein